MSPDQHPHPATRLSAIVTRTSARVQGVADSRIDVRWAHTPDATVTLTWGGILLRFTSANAAQGVLEGFAAARGHLLGVDRIAPPAPAGTGDYALAGLQLTWARRTPYAAVHRHAYSDSQRRDLHWVDLHMGPVTWQILDRQGYDSAIDILTRTHRTAVEVCPDGHWYRHDPTADNYHAPDPILDDYRNHLAAENYLPHTAMQWDGSAPAASATDPGDPGAGVGPD
ncbi:hypothetical protein BJY24_005778 [Nocardia transvalensis]|uniref:Uncharacterized protein n=1 Tax=Nocardia transvalensis TaxID=37333 RepID=A0A7W9PIS5_9NOCA|nr:hypothetical protein [Nocardia transvalensis]MBB5916866.1 hypothetical protein [Nocardia transvalensis]